MSLAAYNERRLASRRRKLVGGKPPRTYVQMQRLAVEIALGTHRGESTRAMAERLGCSHVHCWRVARRYRNGLIPMLPRDEQELVALRDSLDRPTPPQQQAIPWWLARQWRSREEIWGCILLTQEQKVQVSAEFDRREYARQHGLATA